MPRHSSSSMKFLIAILFLFLFFRVFGYSTSRSSSLRSSASSGFFLVHVAEPVFEFDGAHGPDLLVDRHLHFERPLHAGDRGDAGEHLQLAAQDLLAQRLGRYGQPQRVSFDAQLLEEGVETGTFLPDVVEDRRAAAFQLLSARRVDRDGRLRLLGSLRRRLRCGSPAVPGSAATTAMRRR